jgi:DNA polymerase bacteriophage-type
VRELGIDIETYSSFDLTKCGVYKYTEAPDFEILLFAYRIDEKPVEIVDLAQGEQLPSHILYALTDPNVLKTAHNANFEITCIRKYFKLNLSSGQWSCTMAKSTMLGLPLSLDAVGKILKLQAQKDAAGKALIKYFTIPCKPTKVNGERTRNLPQHNAEKWEQFKAYCVRDVEVEQAIRGKISFFEATRTEKTLWHIDQTINDTGILVDPELVHNAIKLDYLHQQELTEEAKKITGLNNPNSVAQLKSWLLDNGVSAPSLNKASIAESIDDITDPTVKRLLELRQEMSKTSVKKYLAMTKAVCPDNRVRGLLQYYGANRTGRWAGRLVQVQNLPRNEMQDLDIARQLVRSGDLDSLEILFDSVPDTLSQLIRTAFVASPGHRFIVADFSAIEARVIAWLAGEKWRLDVFNTHGKIYEASASQMFKVPIDQVSKGSPLRQKGKIAELALGYQGGPNALLKMGALKMGVCDEAVKEAKQVFDYDRRLTGFDAWEDYKSHAEQKELAKLVAMWRQANRKITAYWDTVGDAAINAITDGPTSIAHGIKCIKEKGILFIELPSKRRLSYLRPQLRPNKFGGLSLFYEGMDQTTKQWGLQQTYGGKLVENIVQAIARDVLADAMLRLHRIGYKIVMHVHDEVVSEMPEGKGSKQEVDKIMGTPIPWAKGLPLKAESYETFYYKKD